MKSGRWEDYTAYREGFKRERESRTKHLTHFVLIKLSPELRKLNDARQTEIRLEKSKENTLAYNEAYKKTDRYKKNMKRGNQMLKSRRSESCHNDIFWLLSQFEFDGDTLKYPRANFNKKTGYFSCAIWGKTYMVHRLRWIWENRCMLPDGYEINHINSDKTDNRIENLEISTHLDNMRHYALNSESKRRKKLEYIWKVLSFYYSEPHGTRIETTCFKYGCNKHTLNSWTGKINKADVVNNKKERGINKALERQKIKYLTKNC